RGKEESQCRLCRIDFTHSNAPVCACHIELSHAQPGGQSKCVGMGCQQTAAARLNRSDLIVRWTPTKTMTEGEREQGNAKGTLANYKTLSHSRRKGRDRFEILFDFFRVLVTVCCLRLTST